MWSSRKLLIQTTFVASVFTLMPDFIEALRNVSVTIPPAVKRGDNAILICNYDIENDTLYTVKWYRGRREFYRYTPKENPAWKIFSSTNGLNVDTNQSNASHVFLRNVSTAIGGRYACEVSADAPSFHTLIMGAEMDVIEIPTQRPIVTGIHSRYRLGDIINGNCSSDYSKPAANLTWWINDIQVPPNYLRTFEIHKHIEEQLETSVLEINFIATLQHFIKGGLKLKCSARIHRIYHAETEKYIEEDKPRILASGRSPETFPYDHIEQLEGESGIYFTHSKNYHSSAQSNLLNLNHIARFIFVILPAISSLVFLLLYESLLNLLGLVRQQQSEQQQYTTIVLQNHKTKSVEIRQRQMQRQQQSRNSCFNCPGSCNNEHNSGLKNDVDSNCNNNTDDDIRSTGAKITKLRKSPSKGNKKKTKNSHSLECQRQVQIASSTKADSDKTEADTDGTGHVAR